MDGRYTNSNYSRQWEIRVDKGFVLPPPQALDILDPIQLYSSSHAGVAPSQMPHV